MRKHTIIFLLITLAIGLVGVVYSSSARVQNKTKRTVSEIRFYSELITCPVQYSNLKIKGKKSEFSSMFEKDNKRLEKPPRPETEFEEDDDFWEHLAFSVTNVSDKTIVYLQTNVYLYTKEAIDRYSAKEQVDNPYSEGEAGLAITFGDSSNFNPPYKESLKPGESKSLTVDPQMLDYIRLKVQQFSSPIVRVGIFASIIFFADGSSWSFSGKVFPPATKNKQSR